MPRGRVAGGGEPMTHPDCTQLPRVVCFAHPEPRVMTATAPRKLHNATVTCPFCNGTGKLPHYSHVENGDCFACGASGKLRDLNAFIGNCSDVVLTVWVNNGRFIGAELRRRTWKMSKCSVGSGANQKNHALPGMGPRQLLPSDRRCGRSPRDLAQCQATGHHH